MRKKILEILKEENCNANTLRKRLHLDKDKKNILKELLKEMELDGEVYQTEDFKYMLFPENFRIGKLQITKERKPVVITPEKQQPLKTENLNGALNYDTIIYNIDTLKVEKILKREFSTIVCEVINNKDNVKELKPYNIVGDLKIRIGSIDMKHLNEGDRITVDVSLEQSDDYYEANFKEKIGTKFEPDIELKSIAISNGFQIEFSKESLEQLKTIPQEVTKEDLVGRVDLREKEIFTIDGKDTKDMDDAISIEKLENGNYKLGVHIADVSHYIKEGTPLEIEARERSFSAYLINSVIPMFPKEISNGICSLNPHVDRLTLSCIMEINKNGEIVDYKIEKSIIHSKMKMNYDDVNKVFNGKTPGEYAPFEKSLHLMHELSKILTVKKEERGYLRFDSTEVKFIENEAGKIVEIGIKNKGDAEELIENFMVMANTCVATHLGWIEFIPSVYRNHGNPNFAKVSETIEFINTLGYRIQTIKNACNAQVLQKILEQLSNKDEFPILSTIILRTMKRADYGTKNIGHFALELPFYTHFTSPIRRDPDLQVHYILSKYTKIDLEHEDFKKIEKTLSALCHHASFKERQADKAENDANKLKMAQFMQSHIGEYYEGYVTDIDKAGIYVQTLKTIPGKIDLESLGENYTYNEEKRWILDENNKPAIKIGHHILMYVESVDIKERLTKFRLDKNLTLEEKKIQKKISL